MTHQNHLMRILFFKNFKIKIFRRKKSVLLQVICLFVFYYDSDGYDENNYEITTQHRCSNFYFLPVHYIAAINNSISKTFNFLLLD